MANSNNLNMGFLTVGMKEKEAAINAALNIIDEILTKNTVQTNNATPTTIPLTTAGFVNDSTYDFSGVIVARNVNTDTESKSLKIDFLFRRGVNAAASAIVGSPTITSRYADTGTASWTAAVTADTSGGKPQIQVTGEAAKTIKWVGTFTVTKVTG